MYFRNPYWSNQTRIELLERWILVHSIIYYILNTNIISDKRYDRNSRQLLVLIAKDPEAFEKSRWYYVMKDFDGNTGFDLYFRLSIEDRGDLTLIANNLIYRFKKEKKENV